MFGARGRGMRRGRGKSRTPAHLRHDVAVTLTRYVPPPTPRPREQAAQWRRMVQGRFKLIQDSTAPEEAAVVIKPADWFVSTYSTTGFDAIFIHRVSVWSDLVVPASGQTVWPLILTYYKDPVTGQNVWPSYEGRSSGFNTRAKIGFYVPTHLSGPWPKGSSFGILDIRGIGPPGSNFSVEAVVVELDVTYV